MLSTLGTDTQIVVEHADALPARFGGWGQAVLRLLCRAGAENPHLTVTVGGQ